MSREHMAEGTGSPEEPQIIDLNQAPKPFEKGNILGMGHLIEIPEEHSIPSSVEKQIIAQQEGAQFIAQKLGINPEQAQEAMKGAGLLTSTPETKAPIPAQPNQPERTILSREEAEGMATQSQFTPEDPYGTEGRLPETKITPDQIVNMAEGMTVMVGRVITPEMDLSDVEEAAERLVSNLESQIAGAENKELSYYLTLLAQYNEQFLFYITQNSLDFDASKFFGEIRNKFTGRYLAVLGERSLMVGNVDVYVDIMGGRWNKEIFSAVMEMELGGMKVKEVINLVEDKQGKIFRELDPRYEKPADILEKQLLEKQLLEKQLSDPLTNLSPIEIEKAKKLAELAVRILHLTGVSTQYAGPEDKSGELIEAKIFKEVFPINSRVDMSNEKYWNKRDMERRKRDYALKDIPARELPLVLKRVFFGPEFLKGRSNSEADGLRRVFETGVSDLARVSGFRNCTDLYLNVDKMHKYTYAYAQIIKGGSALLDKVDAGFLNHPVVAPDRAFEDPKKNMTDILKPYLELQDLFLYLGYHGDSEMPDRFKAYILGQTLRYINSHEGQELFGTKRFFGMLPGRQWGKAQYYWAIECARLNGAIGLDMAKRLNKGFGTSKILASLGAKMPLVGKELGGGLLDLFKIITGAK